jgi:ATP-dependent RNA helicase RhlE
LLVDIEKLIKQTILRGELAGFTPSSSSYSSSSSSPRSRDSGAPAAPSERRTRRPEGESAPRLAERPPRSSAPSARRDKVDPWFLKPYEPATPSIAATASSAAPAAKPGRQKLAALLGGMPKP